MTATDHSNLSKVCFTEPAANTTAETPPAQSLPTAIAVGRFNKQATHYNRHAAIQRDMASWLAQWLPAHTTTVTNSAAANTGITSVLDLGAGDGTFTRHLAQHFANVSALDSAEQMLSEGQRNLPQVNWLCGNAWTLQSLATDVLLPCNLIASSSLLQWCRTPAETLYYWAQQCARGTRMLHGFYVQPTLREWRNVFGETGQLDWMDAAQWQNAFAQNGWHVLRSECEVRRYRFTNALELARSLHGTGAIAHPGQLSSGRFRALLREYDTNYLSANLPDDEPLYDFDESPAHIATGIACDAADAFITTQTHRHTRNTQTAKNARGVFASWAFFRIEAERT